MLTLTIRGILNSIVVLIFVFLMGCSRIPVSSTPISGDQLKYLFKSGEDGYKCFRIPAVVVTNENTILAFAEGRKNHCGDADDIDLVLKRSIDGGKTWSPLQVVWDDAGNTCGNPSPVVEKQTGDIILLSTWNLGKDHENQIINQTSVDTRRIFLLRSVDDGRTWSSAKEITSDVKLPDWTWYATGPVNGIQVKRGLAANRLIIPCDHIESGTKKYFSHVIYSDDQGYTWKLGGSTPVDQVNECTIAELSDGTLMLNMRNYNQVRVRRVSTSLDGGLNWSQLREDEELIEPVCQGSLIKYEYRNKKPFLVFSNPADKKSRINMTVRISYDDGKTWKSKNVVYKGPSAYSNLTVLPNGNIACYFEAGIKNAYEGIVFQELRFKDFK